MKRDQDFHPPAQNTPDAANKHRLMTSFAMANVLDVLSTQYALHTLNFKEANAFAADFFQNNNEASLIALKLGIMASLLFVYALSQTRSEGSYFRRPVEKSLRISSSIVWAIVIFNLAQIGAQHLVG